MGFCDRNTETITDRTYNITYKPSVLPNGGSGFSSSVMNSNGIIQQRALDTHIANLIAAKSAIPPMTLNNTNTNPAQTFAIKSTALRNSIEAEYCFYYVRYTYGLTSVLTKAAVGGSQGAVKVEDVKIINSKLNQLIQIIQALSNSRKSALERYYSPNTGVNKLNTDLTRTRESLIRHSKILEKNDLETTAKSAMVEYTIEKNSSSRNLLAVYGFMNIVAIGLLVYMYRQV